VPHALVFETCGFLISGEHHCAMVVFIRQLLAAVLSFSIAVAAFADANNHTTTYAHDPRGRRDLPPSYFPAQK
jgi:hypothetical protein